MVKPKAKKSNGKLRRSEGVTIIIDLEYQLPTCVVKRHDQSEDENLHPFKIQQLDKLDDLHQNILGLYICNIMLIIYN